MHKSSYEKMELFVQKYLYPQNGNPLRILDLGSCDVNGCYKPLFLRPHWTYVGADIASGKNVDIVLSDMYDWRNVKSNSFDVVVSGQVFEHIEYFWVTGLEIARVLKPRGLCCIIAPSGGFEHRYPVDCWRFYTDGFQALSRYAGLELVESFQERDARKYDDGSEVWKDSIMIARKPSQSLGSALSFNLKVYLSKLILKI